MTYVGPKTPHEYDGVPIRSKPPILNPSHHNRLPILAFDPGGTTGWSLLLLRYPLDKLQEDCLANKFAWYHGQINCQYPDEHLGIWKIKRMVDLYPSAAIVFEQFWVRVMAVDTTPLVVIKTVQQHLWEQNRTIYTQAASQAKTTWTDDRLKMANCYQRSGGLNHARDADRHALLFLRKVLVDKSLRREAWPHLYRSENG